MWELYAGPHIAKSSEIIFIISFVSQLHMVALAGIEVLKDENTKLKVCGQSTCYLLSYLVAAQAG